MLDLVASFARDHKVEPVAAGLMSGGCQDLDNFAIAKLILEWNNPAVDLGSGTLVADLSVNRISKIDGSGTARKLDHFAFWREGVDFFRIKIELEIIDKFSRIRDILLPFNQLAEPLECFVFAWYRDLCPPCISSEPRCLPRRS